MTASETHRTIDAVWRIESPRLIAGLARIVRDVGVAEDLAQDALVAALEQWPVSGIPPASESLLALIIIMNRPSVSPPGLCSTSTSNDGSPDRHG